ncbi:MAG TPA: glycosyltransferase [Rhodocyclaceae bacterium]|nr:glycosyltransferase [Rhodocyclaceae bacterium]
MSKTVLMTGFHFPPSALSSGHLRFLAFAKYLPECGWDPVVLSATPNAYELTDPASVRSIPTGCSVYRAFALDTKRHLAVMGKYPSSLALPDRWASWWPAAVWNGLRLIKRHRAQAIWSTFPIMTSHCVAYTLHRLTGIPWIADFRDPVASSTSGKHPMAVRSQAHWERRVLSHASRSVFTTPGAMQWCAERFPEASRAGRLTVIANGYDEEAFVDLGCPPAQAGRPLVLLHSGLLYPEGRSPVLFFAALARLRDSGSITPGLLKVVLRASGSEAAYTREIQRLRLGEMVTLAPPIGNHEALLEQAAADGLLLFQGSKFDLQIPAKVYEYLRIGQPIFALVGPNGDTATLLRESGGAELVAADDVDAIATGLRGFLHALIQGTAPSPRPAAVVQYSRRAGAMLLASLLDQVCT